MMRAAICDDDPIMLKQVEKVVAETFANETFSCKLFCFSGGKELLDAHSAEPFDILFLDIYMPDCNGFDIAKEIRRQSDKPLILFVSSKSELVYDSFNYRPFYFVQKGDRQILQESLRSVARKIIAYVKRNELLTLDMGVGEQRTVCVRDILYLESRSHFTDYHLNNKSLIQIRQTITEAEELMVQYAFVRIHRRFIVNIHAVKKLNLSRFSNVELFSGVTLPLGRTYREATEQKYRDRMREIL